jgi:signal transduction histidine kinase/ActR/RegA family two-component response regulator
MPQTRKQPTRRERRILVLAPSGRDGQLAVEVLGHQGFAATRCASAADLCARVRAGAGAAVVASEALGIEARAVLLDMLRAQPYWSDLPVVVLARGGEDFATLHGELAGACNITFLERPVQIGTLASAVQAALRARQRQYEVRDLVDQLRENDRRKDEFLAMLGHELRNPLGVIRTALELLSDAQSTRARRQVTRIEHQIAHLSRMLDDLLDLSRVSRGRITLQRQPCELRQLVAAALEASTPFTAGREVGFRHGEEPLWVDGDPVRLEQVVTNLLQNAVKYTPPERPIELSVRRDDGWALLSVRDQGIGIRQDELGRIFETFTQLDSSLARSGGGLGLGLSLVRHLVRLHGGKVSAYSDGPGTGSEFVVRVPLLSAHRVPLEPAEGDVPRPEVRPQAPSPDPRRVLVVEDLDDAREALGELLELYGHQVELAADGTTAVDLAVLHPPQVALVDIGLPGLDGYEVARRLRERLGSALVLVAMTGYGQAEDRRRSREAGFDHHLVKPVDPERLVSLLAHPLREATDGSAAASA